MQMEALFPTLNAKTFFILTMQLSITWLTTHLTLRWFHRLYLEKRPWITATTNERGQLDLHVDANEVRGLLRGILIADIALFLALLWWGIKQPLPVSFGLFSLWSITTGVMLGFALISVDENLGSRVLGITACIVAGAFLVNVYTNVDFGFLGAWLFAALSCLIVFNIGRLFINIPRMSQRIGAGFGVIIFTLYLLYDFNRLEKLNKAGVNDWQTATDISIDIYLDIINLILELLDAMGD